MHVSNFEFTVSKGYKWIYNTTDVTSLTNVVYTQRRTNIESMLIQSHYLESALTQCQFMAARPAEVKIYI